MRVVRSLIVSTFVFASVVSVGVARADSAVDTEDEALHGQGHGMVDTSAKDLGLKPDQVDALKKLEGDVHQSRAALRDARRDLALALAQQIEAGKVDAKALEPQTKKVIDASAAVAKAERDALQKARDILTPEQRLKVAAMIRERAIERASKLDVNKHFEDMAKKLNLTPEQAIPIRAMVSELIAAHAQEHARMAIIAEAYLTTGLPLDAIAPPGVAEQRAEQMVRAHVAAAARVAQILTPDQRKAAAQAIRDKVSGQTQKPEPNVGKQSTP